MLDTSFSLEVYSAILRLLDTISSSLEKIPASPNGSEEVPKIGAAAENLKDVGASCDSKKTSGMNGASAETKQTDAERATEKMLERSNAFADRVLQGVQPFKPLEPNARSKSLGGGKFDFEKNRKEADNLRSEAVKQLQQLLNNRQSAAMKKLDELRARDADMEAHVSRRYNKLRQELLTALSQSNGQSKAIIPIWSRLDDMLEEAKNARVAQGILKSLRFEGMESRKHAISETHGDTYEWVFSAKGQRLRGFKANFPKWLESGNGIFWVTGHPGSGKSTLLKFIDDHATTMDKLQTWAGGYRLVKASHFFWVNGSSLQKSQAGLLRSLCFDILRTCPELIPYLCAQRWDIRDKEAAVQDDWATSELEQLLIRLQTSELKVNNEQVRFCFFVDGLDEYSGDHDELVETLQQLASSPHIKICAASRPWNVYEDAFGRDPTKTLTMQDLTTDDIATYVRDVLESDQRLAKAAGDDTKSQDFIEKIINRANGVFLWVHLVVLQVLRCIDRGDDFATLEAQVSEFPSNLDDYFRHMLDTMDVFYQQKTAQIFRLCIRTRQPLALIAFSVLDDVDELSELVKSNENMSEKEIDLLNERLTRQIYTQCPDLLEVTGDGRYSHVQFTHRTVRDFLTHNNMDTLFEERAGNTFHPLETLCHMTIVTLKHLDLLTESSNRKQTYYSLIEDILEYAHDLEVAEKMAPFKQLNQLEEFLERNRDITASLDTNRESPLLPLAVRQNLCIFISQRAEHGPGTLQPVCTYPDRPLLSYALPVFRLRAETPHTFLPEMVRVLLANGSDPNTMSWVKEEEAKEERKASSWSLYLRTLHSMHKRPKTRPKGNAPILVTEAIIEAGAHYVPNCLTEDGNKGEKEILTYVFGKEEAERLLGMRTNPSVPPTKSRTPSGTAMRPSWAKSKSFIKKRTMSLSGSLSGSAVS